MRTLIARSVAALALGLLACLAVPTPLDGHCGPASADRNAPSDPERARLEAALKALQAKRAEVLAEVKEREVQLKAEAERAAAKLQAALQDLKAKALAELAVLKKREKEVLAEIDAKASELKARLGGPGGRRARTDRRVDATLERMLDRLERIERRLDAIEKKSRAKKRPR
jgi:hypothetical protein